MCIGNRDGGDDAVGPWIYDLLQKESSGVISLDCGTAPENFTSSVKQYHPHTVLIIDAAEMSLPVGSIRYIRKENLGRMQFSSHRMPLSILMDYLENEGFHCLLIGIQPGVMSGAMSNAVKKSARHLADMIQMEKIEQIPVI